jgi:hypothetical protein
MAFCIQINVAGIPHRLRDWRHQSMPNGRFARPPHLTGRFDWVDPLGCDCTCFSSFREAEEVAETLSVEEPGCTYTIRPI